jgi:hypothetical protein
MLATKPALPSRGQSSHRYEFVTRPRRVPAAWARPP